MSPRSLINWLRRLAARDAVLVAWSRTPNTPTTEYESDALVVAALGSKTGTPVSVLIPGGHTRLPLLAAAHAAALGIPDFPSPFSGSGRGMVALVTRQTIRRQELAQLDAANVRVSPALHPARLRADGLIVGLTGGSPRKQNANLRLLLVGPAAGWTMPSPSPSIVVVDAANESDEFIDDAIRWSVLCNATPVVFSNVARKRTWTPDTVINSCGWSAITASIHSTADPLAQLAGVRGHAAVLSAGARPDLAAAAALLADARRLGPYPTGVLEAAIVWRRLSELVVPVAEYDAACPRWHTATLSERLDALADLKASAFPRSWATWGETSWAAVKENLASARDALKRNNVKANLLVGAIDADLRAGAPVDVALPSRIARDAFTRHLVAAGVPIAVDGRLEIRSLADVQPWAPRRATVLASPPTLAYRHRVVAGDIGPLNVLCYQHETGLLRRIVGDALNEPSALDGPVSRLLPPALEVSFDLPRRPLPVVLSDSPAVTSGDERPGLELCRLADAVDLVGLAALTTSAEDAQLDDLPNEVDAAEETANDGRPLSQGMQVDAVTLVVVGAAEGPPLAVNLPVQGKVLRILTGRLARLPVAEVMPGMLLTSLDGVTPFERLRPLLAATHGPVARMLLTAWEQALDEAMRYTSGPTGLARALAGEGGQESPSTVAQWLDEDRIGPRDAESVARIGRIAKHRLVAENAAAIAEVMRALRVFHQTVGRAVATSGRLDDHTADELERLLGPDAISIASETVVHRVRSVGPVIAVDRNELHRLMPIGSGDRGKEI